jgi:hypothetical protein
MTGVSTAQPVDAPSPAPVEDAGAAAAAAASAAGAAVVEQDKYVAKFAAREAKIREAVTKQEHARLVRDQLVHCYRKYGVNHRSRCEGISRSYLDAINGLSPYSTPLP